MTEVQILMATLLICSVAVFEFFALVYKQDYLKKMARGVESKEFLVMLVAGFMPAICFFVCYAVTPFVRELHEITWSVMLFTLIGVASSFSMGYLGKIIQPVPQKR